MKNSFKTLVLWTVPLLMGAALIICAVWGKAQQTRAEEYEKLADEYVGYSVDSCARCASELETAVDGMSVSLAKLRVTGSDAGRVLALEDVARESARAASVLSRIPRSQVDVLETASFILRAGDYARSLSSKLLSGGSLESGDTAQLEALLGSIRDMSLDLGRRIAEGGMPMGTEEFDYYEESEDREAAAYPELAYDGEYSRSAEEAEPYGPEGEEGSPEEARAEAERVLGCSLEYEGESGGAIPAYEFTGGGMSVSVSVRGLRVIRAMGEPKGDLGGVPGDAEKGRLVDAARELVKRAGFEDMELFSERHYGGAAQISFVWKTGEVLVYNDKVSVWIDRETGEPIGLDARDYFFSHRERSIEPPGVSSDEARAKLCSGLEADEPRLVLFPLTPGSETLCWEFCGRCSGDAYAVLINARTGAEERVLLIVSDEEGERRV